MSHAEATSLFERARSAIVEANRLSSSIQQLHRVVLASDPHIATTTSRDIITAEQTVYHHATASTAIQFQDEDASLESVPLRSSEERTTVHRLLTVAERLSKLSEEHKSTLSHLMNLRLQQVLLRRQQLNALHRLLTEQLVRLGTPTEAPLTRTVCGATKYKRCFQNSDLCSSMCGACTSVLQVA